MVGRIKIFIMPITLPQFEEARRNISAVALRTPLVRCNSDGPTRALSQVGKLAAYRIIKIRGAANVMARTRREQLERGVLTASAGNMAQGVAFCARRMGIRATIVAPETAPATKIAAVERLGGRVIKVPFTEWWRTFETRSYPGVDATFIHAFDDPDVMAGNGTIGLELLEDLPDIDAVVIPWGGEGYRAASQRFCGRERPTCESMRPRSRPQRRWLHRSQPVNREPWNNAFIRRWHWQQNGLSQHVRSCPAIA